MNLSAELYGKFKYKEALKNVDKALKKNHNFAPALRRKGLILSELKEFSKALEFIDKALEINPSEPDWLAEKGIILMLLGRYEESINLCYQALNIRPNKYWLIVAQVHGYFKKFDDALDCVEKALFFQSNNVWVKHVKHSIVDGIKYGENYYVPITRSFLLLDLPPEDTIIYTTRIKIKRLNQNTLTDAIMTNNGIICYVPFTGFRYISWDKIRFKSKDSFTFSGFKCELLWEPRYESSKEFKARSKKFKEVIYQLREETTKNN